MDWGWRYNLMVWVLDILVLRRKLRAIRMRACDLAGVHEGEAVLDFGCGTGTLALEPYRRVGRTCRVSGVDPGPRQIARAQSKAQRAGFTIDFELGVIEHLPFVGGSFDVVLNTMMMHHLPRGPEEPGAVRDGSCAEAG